MFSQGEEAQETTEAVSSDESKSLRGLCTQNDSVDKPRILFVLSDNVQLDEVISKLTTEGEGGLRLSFVLQRYV